MQSYLDNIIHTAVNAPSGDNTQPWEFSLGQDALYVRNISNADESFYNFRQYGTFFSHGALIENITIAATTYGKRAEVLLFPDSNDHACIAKIVFHDDGVDGDPLAEAIVSRCTNRKPYRIEPIDPSTQSQLATEINNFSGAQLHLLSDRSRIDELSRSLSLNERLILEHRGIHDGLFSYIRWSIEEEREKGGGLYIKTLELAPPQEKAFSLFRHWNVLTVLNTIFGVAKLVAKDNTKLYAATPLYGLLTLPEATTPTHFIIAGRCMERIWLRATRHGLSVQPTGALLYLAQRVRHGEKNDFSETQKRLILESVSSIQRLFAAQSGVPVMLFRIGYTAPPSARSYKRPPHIRP